MREIRESGFCCRWFGRSNSSPLFFHQGRAFPETFAEVSQFGAACLALAFDFDFVDTRRVDGKNALDAFAVADAADGEHFVQTAATTADHDAGKNLDAFLVAF